MHSLWRIASKNSDGCTWPSNSFEQAAAKDYATGSCPGACTAASLAKVGLLRDFFPVICLKASSNGILTKIVAVTSILAYNYSERQYAYKRDHGHCLAFCVLNTGASPQQGSRRACKGFSRCKIHFCCSREETERGAGSRGPLAPALTGGHSDRSLSLGDCQATSPTMPTSVLCLVQNVKMAAFKMQPKHQW